MSNNLAKYVDLDSGRAWVRSRLSRSIFSTVRPLYCYSVNCPKSSSKAFKAGRRARLPLAVRRHRLLELTHLQLQTLLQLLHLLLVHRKLFFGVAEHKTNIACDRA
jgi:hypothetical protein